MVGSVSRQPTRGSEFPMSKKSPQARDGKKVPQLSLKEKRLAKRSKQEPATFIKPRKGANA